MEESLAETFLILMPGRDSKCKEKNPTFTMLMFKKEKEKKMLLKSL